MFLDQDMTSQLSEFQFWKYKKNMGSENPVIDHLLGRINSLNLPVVVSEFSK